MLLVIVVRHSDQQQKTLIDAADGTLPSTSTSASALRCTTTFNRTPPLSDHLLHHNPLYRIHIFHPFDPLHDRMQMVKVADRDRHMNLRDLVFVGATRYRRHDRFRFGYGLQHFVEKTAAIMPGNFDLDVVVCFNPAIPIRLRSAGATLPHLEMAGWHSPPGVQICRARA